MIESHLVAGIDKYSTLASDQADRTPPCTNEGHSALPQLARALLK